MLRHDPYKCNKNSSMKQPVHLRYNKNKNRYKNTTAAACN